MMFEAWLQLRGEAPEERRISTYGQRDLALTHNLGGYPGEMVSFVGDRGHRALLPDPTRGAPTSTRARQ